VRPRALQTDKFCAISYQFGGPFIYIFCLKVLGGLQTEMIPLPSYQFKGPLIFSFTKICSYLIGDQQLNVSKNGQPLPSKVRSWLKSTPDLIWSFLCNCTKMPRFLDNSSSQRMVKKKGTFKMSSTTLATTMIYYFQKFKNQKEILLPWKIEFKNWKENLLHTLKNWIQKMERNSTTPKNCVLTKKCKFEDPKIRLCYKNCFELIKKILYRPRLQDPRISTTWIFKLAVR
jgi:hypothetical protein